MYIHFVMSMRDGLKRLRSKPSLNKTSYNTHVKALVKKKIHRKERFLKVTKLR